MEHLYASIIINNYGTKQIWYQNKKVHGVGSSKVVTLDPEVIKN
jgi:hypothetical protein